MPTLLLPPLLLAVVLLATVGLALWRVSGRTLYWDDFLIPSKYGTTNATADPTTDFPSFTELFNLHDGHLMPGAIALQTAVNTIAPLRWWLPALLIVLGTALCTIAWWLGLRTLTRGRSIAAWLALCALAFSPFLGAALGWWSAAINALGWQVSCALALLFLHSGRQRSAVFLSINVLIGLVFTEKALSIIPLLTAVAMLFPVAFHASRRELLKRLAPAWGLTVVWAGLYWWRVASESNGAESDAAESTGVVFSSIPHAVISAIVPGMAGGPWRWDRWEPGMSFAAPTTWMQVLAGVLVVAGLAWWVWRHRRHCVVAFGPIGLSVGYLLAVFVALSMGRSGVGTSDVITRSMHYYADWFATTILALMVAHVAAQAEPLPARQPRPATKRVVLAGVLCGAMLVSAAISTKGFLATWADDKTPDWIHTVSNSLRASPAPLLPQPVPHFIAFRFGQEPVDIGVIAAEIPDWPGVASATPTPQFLSDDGRLVPGDVLKISENEEGTAADCGHRIPLGGRTRVKLTEPIEFGEWTWELNATATQDVDLRIVTPNGLETYAESVERARWTTVPQQLTRQYVRISGGGGTLELLAVPKHSGGETPKQKTATTAGHVCVGTGPIGPLLPANPTAD